MFADNQTIDNMHRQSSRIISNSDAIDCIVNTNDLAFEHELVNQEYDQQRASSDSRRNQTSKRTNGNSIDRSTRHSPPSVTRKRQSSPPSTSLLSTRSRHHYYPSQRHHRVSGSPSPPPPPPQPQTSSRHHRPSRPVTSVKRPHSKSRSPYERRPSTHRSYRESSKKRISDNEELPSTKKQTISTKPILKQDISDLSVVSEDESIKPYDIQSNSSTINQSPSNNKLHSTPSLPILQPNSNESLLEMSTIPRDGELSLFAKSALSMTNTSSIITTPTLPVNDFIQTIDLMSKYKTMQAVPSNNKEIEACSKEMLMLIQKQIELHKKELDYREREMKLRECELAEREKRFNERLNDPASLTSVISEPLVVVKSAIIEEKPQPKSEIVIDQVMTNVSQQESVEESIPSTVDASQVNLVNKNGSGLPSLTRKNRERSRFSELIVNPSIFASQPNPVVNLYSDDHDADQSSSSINPIHSFKKTIASKILVPSESTKSIVDTDLKVTSSNLCRKVEIQSEPIHKPTTSKGSSHDLRLTLSKNRTKQQNNDDNTTTNSNQILIGDEQIVTIDKLISSKINSIKEDKQQSHDYQQQRSVTSTSIETIIDDTNDKRDHHRHQQQQLRTNSGRQQQYSGQNSSSSITVSNERSYTHGSTSQQLSKYGSNQKRHDNNDLRSRLFEHKPPKSSSRSTNRDNY